MNALLRRACGLLVGVVGLAIFPSGAQNYPVRPVRMIVPFSPGGAADVPGRVQGVVPGEGDAFQGVFHIEAPPVPGEEEEPRGPDRTGVHVVCRQDLVEPIPVRVPDGHGPHGGVLLLDESVAGELREGGSLRWDRQEKKEEDWDDTESHPGARGPFGRHAPLFPPDRIITLVRMEEHVHGGGGPLSSGTTFHTRRRSPGPCPR